MIGELLMALGVAVAIIAAIRIQINSFGSEDRTVQVVGLIISLLILVAVFGVAFVVN